MTGAGGRQRRASDSPIKIPDFETECCGGGTRPARRFPKRGLVSAAGFLYRTENNRARHGEI